jgi:nitroimidazol reductase NimA-like FMN-containing flavoprotein (pyridoxamine 5'-phosphate oxidase superfamily)
MRRNDKQINDCGEVERLLDEAQVMRLGMIDDGMPYVVPVNFAHEDGVVWVHGAAGGRKLACLRDGAPVCIEVDRLLQVTTGPRACDDWTSHYESAIGFGTGEVVEDEHVKLEGLRAIMRKYSGRHDWEFTADSLQETAVIRIRLDELTGKRSPAR